MLIIAIAIVIQRDSVMSLLYMYIKEYLGKVYGSGIERVGELDIE